MRYLVDRLTTSGYDTKISICGFDGRSYDHIVVPEIKCLFVSCNDYHKIKDVSFAGEYCVDDMPSTESTLFTFDTILKCKLKFDELLLKAEYCLKDASEQHHSLESYYIEAMNFGLLNEYCQKILFDVEKNLDKL